MLIETIDRNSFFWNCSQTELFLIGLMNALCGMSSKAFLVVSFQIFVLLKYFKWSVSIFEDTFV
jgi:hypothetical protein